MIIFGQDEEQMKTVIDQAGPIAMLFVLALGGAIFVIWRSLKKQIGRIDPNLPKGTDDERQAADERYQEEAVKRGEEEAAKRDAGDVPPAG